jgi:diguanylate cyclase (GGDEF)-like protein/PAS domain S-box-containing protein
MRARTGSGSALPGGRETARVGAGVLVVLYLALVPVQLVLTHGPARWVTVAAAAVTAAAAAVAAGALRAGRGGSERRTDLVVWFVCSAPLANSLLQLLVTRRLEQTTFLMLSVVAIGAVTIRPLRAAGLVATACILWAVTVAGTHLGPSGAVLHYAVQLLLACALSAAVVAIRSMVGRRLAESETRLVEQLLKMEGVRGRLAESLTQFRGVFDDSPVGIGLSDENGRFIQVNAALCRLLGRAREEILGRSSLEFTHPDDRAFHARATELIEESSDGIARVEKRYVRPDGEVRWAWLTFTHVRGEGVGVRTLAHVQDVTERKQADESLARTKETLEAAADIARVTQLGGDPRPVVLDSLQRLARASSVLLFEPVGDDRLVVTATSGEAVSMAGVELSLRDRSALAHVWRTGQPMFVSEVGSHPLANRRLAEVSGASSLQLQPVGLDGELHGVLAILWDGDVADRGVSAVERSVVEVLAAETGAALTGERLRRRLEELSIRDPLTGLLNRRGWDGEIAAMRSRCARGASPLTLAIVDLDHFKAYNDNHGHQAGDDLLAGFAARAREVLRETDSLARWGGEEFALALPDCQGSQAAEILSRVRTAVPGAETCSVGYALLGPDETTAQCLARADVALYRAKRLGRDRVEAAADMVPAPGPATTPDAGGAAQHDRELTLHA